MHTNHWQYKFIFFGMSSIILATQFSGIVLAQALYKYTDAEGKITYSDRVPKPGEKAELVKSDAQANVIAAPKNTLNGVKQSITDVNARGKQLEVNREKLQKEVDSARAEVAKAKKMLADGEEPLQEERQIVTHSGSGNTVIVKEEYRERIAKLQANIKAAEENLEKAEQKYRRTAP